MSTADANRALWGKGDFTQIAASMRAGGDALVASLGVAAGLDVLDLGSGDGTTAVPSAQRGATVLGVDIAPNLVAAGNARAQSLGLANLRFREGDAADLRDLDDASFDLTMSMFGAMFAPRPFDVAREMVRVTRPGGRVVMGNWIPGHPTLPAQILRISSAYTPPPPEGFVSPMTWGMGEHVLERFGAAGIAPARVSLAETTFDFEFAGSPSAYLDAFRRYFGPTMDAYAAAAAAGREEELHAELDALFHQENTSGKPDVTSISAGYLLVTVRT